MFRRDCRLCATAVRPAPHSQVSRGGRSVGDSSCPSGQWFGGHSRNLCPSSFKEDQDSQCLCPFQCAMPRSLRGFSTAWHETLIGLEQTDLKLVYLSLGSNIGDREQMLQSALDQLQAPDLKIQRVSFVYESEPVDFKEQRAFLNLVAEAETELFPMMLLS